MNNVIHFVHGGGFVMYPLLIIAVFAIAVIIERLIAFGQYGGLSHPLLAKCILLARSRKYDEALKACEEVRGPMAACLAVVIRHRTHPTREIERLVEETGQEYFIRLERFLPILDTTTTCSPLLGLLGTIVGMIGAFNAIAQQQHHGNNDAVLAGVGEALYATATGLIIAVVCFAAYNYFASRLRNITAETEQASTKLINVLIERTYVDRGQEHDYNPNVDAEAGNGIQTPTRA